MFKKLTIAAVLLILLSPSLSFALGECRQDRKKYCPNAGLNEDKVKACLKENFKNLSAPCKEMIKEKVEKKVEKKLENQNN